MPRKSLSQNFLSDPRIIGRIVEASSLKPGETVLEIGPGPGALTRALLAAGAHVVAVEYDRSLAARLAREFEGNDAFTLHISDIMKFPLESIKGKFRVVANIPYHITTPIIFRLLEEKRRLLGMTLTVQKELADRAASPPGSKTYGTLSVMLQYHGRVSREFVIPKGAFWPRPKVDSACLNIEIARTPTVEVANEETFRRIVRTAFMHRRKTLINSIKSLGDEVGQAIASADIDPKRRPETLSIEEFAAIANACPALSGQ